MNLFTALHTRIASILLIVMVSAILLKKYAKYVPNNNIYIEMYDENDFNDTFYEYFDLKMQQTKASIQNILNMKRQIKKINEEQVIFNRHLYGNMINMAYTIVVQVNTNIIHFEILLESLRYVVGISNALLIFSHNNFDADINNLVGNVTFAKYLQIFYPYSSQLHPNIFPGADPNFCVNDFYCTKSEGRRDHYLTQLKHHWWWQANQIFDHLEAIQQYNGSVVFLEEDNYVTKDFIYMLKLLENMMPEYCPHCDIISLGAHAHAVSQFHVTGGYAVIEPWDSTLQNTGIAFNRNVWNIIKNLSYHFCHFSGSNWYNSLKFLATKRPEGRFLLFSSEGPRVLRIGMCDGLNTNCSMNRKIKQVKNFAKLIWRGLFPQNIIIRTENRVSYNITENGEWQDVRDQELCMYISRVPRKD